MEGCGLKVGGMGVGGLAVCVHQGGGVFGPLAGTTSTFHLQPSSLSVPPSRFHCEYHLHSCLKVLGDVAVNHPAAGIAQFKQYFGS